MIDGMAGHTKGGLSMRIARGAASLVRILKGVLMDDLLCGLG